MPLIFTLTAASPLPFLLLLPPFSSLLSISSFLPPRHASVIRATASFFRYITPRIRWLMLRELFFLSPWLCRRRRYSRYGHFHRDLCAACASAAAASLSLIEYAINTRAALRPRFCACMRRRRSILMPLYTHAAFLSHAAETPTYFSRLMPTVFEAIIVSLSFALMRRFITRRHFLRLMR